MTVIHTVMFRLDAGPGAGLGHLHRCLALAEALRQRGVTSTFLIDGPEAVAQRARLAGFEARTMEGACDTREVFTDDVGALVVDSYRVDANELASLQQPDRKLVVIDDLAARNFPPGLVVNGAVGAERLGYRDGRRVKVLLGPRFAMVRRAFRDVVPWTARPQIERVLVTAGGGAALGWIDQFVRAVRSALMDVEIDVVASGIAGKESCSCWASEPGLSRISVHVDPPDLPALMARADLALCAGGQTTYELAVVGVPTIATIVAENQAPSVEGMAAAGIVACAGRMSDPGWQEEVGRAIRGLALDEGTRALQSSTARRVIDGRGADRVAEAICGILGENR